MDTDSHIDQLLERYLGLLDEYTTLRQGLSNAHAGMFQSLARANFSAERGMRYGPDYFDDRMQASRLVTITQPDEGSPKFQAARVAENDAPVGDGQSAKEEKSYEETAGDSAGGKKDGDRKTSKPKDPIHWYGILAPMPLRQAQNHAIQAVEDVIPRLVTVNAEMLDVEIQVRRARKKRTKAEAEAAKPSVDNRPTSATDATVEA